MIATLFGTPGLVLYLGQAASGILMLEVVNYIEHYALRRKLVNGRYERVGRRHSWNANSLFSNSVIFRLQRHTDHHMHSSKPYHVRMVCFLVRNDNILHSCWKTCQGRHSCHFRTR